MPDPLYSALLAAHAAVSAHNANSPRGQDYAVELVGLLDQALDVRLRMNAADEAHDRRVEGFLARNDAMWGAA